MVSMAHMGTVSQPLLTDIVTTVVPAQAPVPPRHERHRSSAGPALGPAPQARRRTKRRSRKASKSPRWMRKCSARRTSGSGAPQRTSSSTSRRSATAAPTATRRFSCASTPCISARCSSLSTCARRQRRRRPRRAGGRAPCQLPRAAIAAARPSARQRRRAFLACARLASGCARGRARSLVRCKRAHPPCSHKHR